MAPKIEIAPERRDTFARKLQGFHEDSSIKNLLEI